MIRMILRESISDCLGMGEGDKWERWDKGLSRDTRKLLEVVDMVTILILVIVSQIYTYVKIYLTVYLK